MNNEKKFLRIVIDSPLYRFFDYLPPNKDCDIKSLKSGMRIKVPFGPRKVIGFLVAVIDKTDVPLSKLRPALEVLDKKPIFSERMWNLLLWAADYYHYPLGSVSATALPKFLRTIAGQNSVTRVLTEIAKKKDEFLVPLKIEKTDLVLNDYQKLAIDSITKSIEEKKGKTFLLDGITGSGKTEVYLQVIEKVIEQGKQALVLIPEIGLTPQTVTRFKARFKVPIALFHSRLTDRERVYNWVLAALGYAKIVIGTRSAIFTPLIKPGVIVIDEEHDLSFRQQSGFRYTTRDLAIKRSALENIPLILGSATPSLSSLFQAFNHQHEHLLLPERAGEALHPTFQLVDLRGAKLKGGFSLPLLEAIKKHLDQGSQVLVFLNRRGYAPTVMCHTCGWVAECQHCDVRLTLHQKPSFLSCHHCGKESSVPTACPGCGSNNIMALGLGTARAEVMLNKLFPEANIHRIDRDTTQRKGSLESMFNDVKSGLCQILVGTQMLTKGHHFPNVTLVAILNADGGLFSADFQALEYLSQLIIQVAGRAGRSDKMGEVYIQTHNPEHPLLTRLVESGYGAFAQDAIIERRNALLPPFSNLALIRVESKDEEVGLEFLRNIKTEFLSKKAQSITILGPIKASMARRAGKYRAQLWLQSDKREDLDTLLEAIKDYIVAKPKRSYQLKWFFDIDPVEI